MAATADLAIIIKAIDQSSGPLRAVSQALHGLGEAAALPGKALGGLMDGLGKVGLAGMGIKALAEGARGLGDAMGVGLLSEMEQVRASINAFTKDGTQTEAILKQIRTEANLTPYAFKELATATAALMPVAKQSGIALMDLVKEAEILAASNPMEGLAGASFSLREAMTGDFTSIIERFNLSRQTINKLKAEGVPNLEIIRRAMKEMGFDEDLIAAKAQTLQGRWSTFMDTIDDLKMRVSQPIFDALKEGLVGLQGLFDDNKDAITGFADGVGQNIGRVIDIFKALFVAFNRDAGAMGIVLDKIRELFGDTVADAVQPFIHAFMLAIPPLKAFAASGGDLNVLAAGLKEVFGIDISGYVAAFETAKTVVQNVATVLGESLRMALEWLANTGWPTLTAAITSAIDALNSVLRFFSENTAAAAALIGVVTMLATAWVLYTAQIVAHNIAVATTTAVSTAITTATKAWAAAQLILNAVMSANPIGLVITVLAGLAAALIYAYNNSEEFRAIVDAAMTAVSAAFTSMWSTVGPALGELFAALARMWTEMQPALLAAWQAIQSGVTTSMGAVSSFVTLSMQALSSAWSTVWGAIETAVRTVWGVINTVTDVQMTAVKTVITAGLQILKGDWSGAWETMRSGLADVWGKIQSAASGAMDGLKSTISGILNGLIDTALESGRGMVNAFAQGIMDKLNGLLDRVREMVQKIRDLLPGSDAKVGPLSDLTRSGQGLPRALAAGIKQASGDLERATRAALASIPREIDTTVSASMPSLSGGLTLAGATAAAGMPAYTPTASTSTVLNVHVNVAGSVTAEKDLAETIRQQLYRTMKRNGSLGFA